MRNKRCHPVTTESQTLPFLCLSLRPRTHPFHISKCLRLGDSCHMDRHRVTSGVRSDSDVGGAGGGAFTPVQRTPGRMSRAPPPARCQPPEPRAPEALRGPRPSARPAGAFPVRRGAGQSRRSLRGPSEQVRRAPRSGLRPAAAAGPGGDSGPERAAAGARRPRARPRAAGALCRVPPPRPGRMTVQRAGPGPPAGPA